MVKRTGPTNVQLKGLVQFLRKTGIENGVQLWKRIADDLEQPTRIRRAVNLYRIDKYTKANETIIVPGKVLGTGVLNHKVNVVAYAFSEGAKKKIIAANGTIASIADAVEKNPKAQKMRIIG